MNLDLQDDTNTRRSGIPDKSGFRVVYADLSGLNLPESIAPAGRYVYSNAEFPHTQAPVALNPDLSGRGDMSIVHG